MDWFSFGGASDFYPRSPCGERRSLRQLQFALRYFYPRSPCGERRGSGVGSWPRAIFLSTLSLRRATSKSNKLAGRNCISIHALLAESDPANQTNLPGEIVFLSTLSLRRATSMRIDMGNSIGDFYPRSPCGERRQSAAKSTPEEAFLSTLSLRRATRETGSLFFYGGHFYPRSPCGERR